LGVLSREVLLSNFGALPEIVGADAEARQKYAARALKPVDLLTELLSLVLAGLSAILMAIAVAAALRYSDARLGLVAGALALFVGIGLLSFVHQVSPLYGPGLGVDPAPLTLAVVAVALLYLALVRGRPPVASSGHG
jgi:hypothetical protein